MYLRAVVCRTILVMKKNKEIKLIHLARLRFKKYTPYGSIYEYLEMLKRVNAIIKRPKNMSKAERFAQQ